MESRQNDKEVFSPLNEFTENNHEDKDKSLEASTLHCNSGDSTLSQRIRDRASHSDANLPSTDENNEHSNVRDRTSSQQSIATTITKSVLDQVSSVVPASIVVAVMPWMEEERALEPHQEAAILLEYARDGQDLNGSKLTLRSRLCYRLRHKYHLFFRAAAWGLVLIHIFERPRWTYDPNNSSDWFDSHKFPSWQLSYIDSTTANILVFVCLILNWIGVGLELGYKQNTSNVYLPWTAFWILFIKTAINIGKLIVISQNLAPSFSVSPIEGFLCILVELQYDNNIGFLLRSIPKFCILMIGMAVFVLIYTTLGMLIFDPTQGEGLEIFGNYGIALWNMAMILNGANWPGPMVPAIVQNRLFVLYFYVFLILVVWGLLNIVLGFNYLFFQSEQKEIADLQEKTRINNKADAFRILDIERKGYLTYEQIDALLKEMYEFYEELATPPSTAERYELILSLDIQSNNMIDENDFYFIEQKCFQGALKVMRSRKRKFMRFISANILREQSAQILKKQTDKLKIVSVAVGINVHTLNTDNSSNNNTSSSGYRNLEDTESNNENGIELIRPQDSTLSNTTNNTNNTATSHFIQQNDSERVISPLHESNTTTNSATDNNNEINLDNISNKSNNTTTEAEDHESRERRASLIERASRYASKNVDPKVLAWYKSVGDSQIVEMSRERGRTIAMWVSHFAMQVDSIYFDIFSDTLIVSIGISLLLHNAHKAAVITYNVFTLCEMFLKLAVKGYYRYSMSNRSAIDGKIAITLLALTIIDAAIPHRNHSTIIIKTLVLLRTLLYPRNLIVTNGFKEFRNRQRLAFHYAFGTVDHFNFLLLVLVVMMYIFAGVGQQIFGGTIHRGSQRVEGSAYANSEFWPLNFNDMPSGMVTMFTLLSVNDMNVTTSGFTAALSQWAEVFFILWYCLGVLFFLNILTAVFLNQFIGYLEQLAVERRAEAERLRRESDASSSHRPLSIEYYVPSESLDGAQTPPGRRKYSNTSSIGDEDYAHHRSMSVPSYAPETSVPSWMRDHTDSSATAPEQHLQRDDAFYPPEYQFEEENVVSGDASQPGAGRRRRSMLQVPTLLTDATQKTGALLADATHKTGALLTDATAKTGALLSEATMTATTKATELVHSSTTGLNFLKNFLIVDDTQDFVVDSKTTEDTHTATGTTAGALAGVGGELLHLDIHNPLVMGRRRNSSLSSVQSPLTPTGSYFHSHRLSTASNPRINTRRGSNFNFIPLREQDLSLEDTGDEDPNMTALDAIEEEEDPTAPITAKKGFTQSIFASDEDRAKIDNWVKSQFKKKRTAARNRRISGYSGGQRSRTNTGGWDVDFSLHPPSIFGGTRSRTESKAITVHSDDMEVGEGKKIGSPMHLGSSVYARKRTISSERGETFNALLSAAANDPTTIPTADGGAATDGMGDGTAGPGDAIGPDVLGGDIDLGSIGGHSRGFHSVHTSDEHASQMQEGIDPSTQTWTEWFYEPNAVSVYEEAAVLIQGAADGEDPNLFTSRRGLQCFQERTRRAWYFKMAAVLYSCLKFFQRPAWTFDQPQWNNSTYFPVSGMPQWSPVVTGSLKIPLLLVIMYGMLLEVGQQEATLVGILRQHTWISTMRYVLLFYCVVQLILVLYSLSGGPQSLVAFSSCGSMLYVLWFNRRSLKKLRMVLQVVPRLSMVMVLYFLIVCMFSGFGPFLYNIEEVGADDDVSGEYYKNFRTATWSIFVAITSSSYPMQIMPAYREYREFSLFFFLFITIGALFMLNLIIAIVFVEFQKASQLNSDYQRAIRQVLLMRAFDILDQDEVDEINIIQLNLLINELIKNYASFQKRLSNPKAREVLIITLDGNFNGLVRMDEFLFFLEKAKFKLPIVAVPTFMEKYFPNIVEKPSFLMLKKMVLYPYTNLIFDCTIAIFTVTSLIVNHNNLYRASPSSVALGAIQMIIMVVEMTVKLMVRGYAAYRRSFRNQLDSTITIGAFISVLGSAAYTGVSMFTIFRRVLLIFRLFWLPRNLRYIFDSKGIKRFAKLCWRIVGKTLTLGIVFLCILYVFASIGTFAFGGLINRDPSGPRYEALMGSRYAADGYFPLNFNDFTSSIITVFACLHVSDFDVITEGMVVTSNNSTARIYFALWYIVGVLLMLNILKSFFLDEFLSVFSTGMFGESEPEPSKKLDVVLEEEEDMDSETHVHNPMVYTPLRGSEASATEGSSSSSNSSSLMMPPISAELELHRSPAPVLPTIRETESDFESPTHTPSPQPQSSNTSATDLQHTVAGATQREGMLEQLQPAAQPSKPVKPPRSAPPPPPHAPMPPSHAPIPPPLPSMPPPPVPKFPLQVAPAAVHTLLEQEEDWVVSEGESDEEGLLETIPEGSEDEGESGAESLDSSRLG